MTQLQWDWGTACHVSPQEFSKVGKILVEKHGVLVPYSHCHWDILASNVFTEKIMDKKTAQTKVKVIVRVRPQLKPESKTCLNADGNNIHIVNYRNKTESLQYE